MSTSINSLYEAGLFATPSYIDWTPVINRTRSYELTLQDAASGTPGSSGPNPAADKVLTEAQAKEFADKYQLADYWQDAQTGFAATVFSDKRTNRFIVAFRGVEPGQGNDWLSAITAVVSSANLIMESPQAASLQTYMQRLRDRNILPAGSVVEAAGLSLGGALTQMFVRDFAGVSSATTFNSPGLPWYNTASSPALTNVLSDRWPDGIAFVGKRNGPEVRVYVESDLHATAPVITSLAVMNAFGKLDSTLTVQSMNLLFDASSNGKTGVRSQYCSLCVPSC